MKKSARAKRMERRHKFMKPAIIQLTSLIDILTVLVFFLLVNQQNVTQIPGSEDLQLPRSTSEQMPGESLAIMVNKDYILVQGVKVADIAEIARSKSATIPGLAQELQYRASKTPPKLNDQGIPEREVMIIGDKGIPYALLRKIMATCSENDYSKISFAVLRKKEDAS
ncbi:MAG: ExbD/TolR family protein [Pseudomonadota bacterium]